MGSPPNFGDGVVFWGLLTALSDNAKAVVGEVFKAVSTALDEFEFAMEALGDAIVFGEAPHGRQRFSPGRQGLSEGKALALSSSIKSRSFLVRGRQARFV